VRNQDAKSYRQLPAHNTQHSRWTQHVLFRSVHLRFRLKSPEFQAGQNVLSETNCQIKQFPLHISGTFIARQSRFVPCGYTIASMSMILKFLIGPLVMLVTSLVVGMHGTLLRIVVVQVSTKKKLYFLITLLRSATTLLKEMSSRCIFVDHT
jgi:hypothetical protein